MRRPVVAFLVRTGPLLVLCATAATAVVVPASATYRGSNGPIAFARFPALWVVNADGTGLRRLPHPARTEDINPDWSPDGSRIAFERCSTTNCEVWTIRANGTGARRLGPNCLRRPDAACGDRGAPSWSPDGRRLAFGQGSTAVRNGVLASSEIYVMNADGTGVRQVTHVSDSEPPYSMDVLRPAWSPNGRRLAFEVQHFQTADPPNRRAIFIVNADGSGLRQLTDWNLNGGDRPDWSPDGRLILFRAVSRAQRHSGNLYTIHPDGTSLRQITRYPGGRTVGLGSFSPDGTSITFSRFSDTPYPAVYVMRANGTSIRRITVGNGASAPDWGITRR